MLITRGGSHHTRASTRAALTKTKTEEELKNRQTLLSKILSLPLTSLWRVTSKAKMTKSPSNYWGFVRRPQWLSQDPSVQHWPSISSSHFGFTYSSFLFIDISLFRYSFLDMATFCLFHFFIVLHPLCHWATPLFYCI